MNGIRTATKHALKRRLWVTQSGLCYWCRRRMEGSLLHKPQPGWLPERCPTLDHLIPRSKGGRNRQENFVLACLSCNQRRGNNIDWRPEPAREAS